MLFQFLQQVFLAENKSILIDGETVIEIYLFMNLDAKKQKRDAMNQEVLPCFSPRAKSIVVGGFYDHYKGFRYKILGIARHSETLEELVVYQALYGDSEIWVRPLEMFLENMTINGQSQPRFKLVESFCFNNAS